MARILLPSLLLLASCAAPAPSAPVPPPLRARVVFVDTRFDFLVIGKGAPEGLKPGMEFEIVQDGRDGAVRLGWARLEKFMGSEAGMSKLRLEEGVLSLVKVDDWALYRLKE